MTDAGRASSTLTAGYFERIYEADPDPWKFATSDYERHKYADTLAALPGTPFASALEVGCSIGVLTRQLAGHCHRLLAVDAATQPLEEARRRCADQPWVRFERCFVPDEWPAGSFDLIVLSEVVYYLVADDVARLAQRMESSLDEAGLVLLVHWTGPTDYPLSGDEATERLIAATSGFTTTLRQQRAEQFRLDLLQRSRPFP